MPNLPKYQQQGVQRVRVQGVSGFDYPNTTDIGSRAWANAAKKVSRDLQVSSGIAGQIRQSVLNRKIEHSKVEISKHLTDFASNIDQRQDFETWDEELDKQVQALQKEHTSGAMGPDAISHINTFIQDRAVGTRRYAGGRALKLQVDIGRKEIYKEVLDIEDRIPKAVDFMSRLQLVDDLEQSLKAAEADGFLGAAEGFQMLEESKVRVHRQLALDSARAMGYEEGITCVQGEGCIPQDELDALGLRPLDQNEKDAIVADLRREWAAQKVAEKAEQEATHEKTNRDFVQKFNNNQLDKDTVLASGLAPDGQMGQQWWLDRITARSDAILAGKGDPFKNTTDFEAYGNLMEEVMQYPESVTDNDIWEMHGQGIGTRDLYAIQNVRDGKLTKDPEKKDLHSRWSKHLIWCRKEGVWNGGTSLDDRQDNNKQYMDVQTTFDKMVADNPDITNKEIQEWFDGVVQPSVETWLGKKVREWKEVLFGGDTGKLTGNVGGIGFEIGTESGQAEDNEELNGLMPGHYRLDNGRKVMWDGEKIVRYE